MKNKYLISLIGLLFAIPFVSVFASTPCDDPFDGFPSASCNYTRTPSGLSITNPIVYDLTVDLGGSYNPADFSYWGLAYQNAENTAYIGYSEIIPLTELTHTFTNSLPVGSSLSAVNIILIPNNNSIPPSDCFNTCGWYALENFNDPNFLNVIASPTPAGIITLPAGLTTGLTNNASSLFGDIAPYLLIIVGIPFGIYIIKKVLSLIPKK